MDRRSQQIRSQSSRQPSSAHERCGMGGGLSRSLACLLLARAYGDGDPPRRGASRRAAARQDATDAVVLSDVQDRGICIRSKADCSGSNTGKRSPARHADRASALLLSQVCASRSPARLGQYAIDGLERLQDAAPRRARSQRASYRDLAITPPAADEIETLAMFQETSGGEAAVAKKRREDELREKVAKLQAAE